MHETDLRVLDLDDLDQATGGVGQIPIVGSPSMTFNLVPNPLATPTTFGVPAPTANAPHGTAPTGGLLGMLGGGGNSDPLSMITSLLGGGGGAQGGNPLSMLAGLLGGGGGGQSNPLSSLSSLLGGGKGGGGLDSLLGDLGDLDI